MVFKMEGENTAKESRWPLKPGTGKDIDSLVEMKLTL